MSCSGGSTPPPASGDVIVDFPGTTVADPALLLYSGMENSVCQRFEADVANPTVTLTNVSFDSGCGLEIDAFAPGLGAYGRLVNTLDPGDETWFLDAISAGALSISLPTMTVVPLRLWLVGYPNQMDSIKDVRNRLLDKAYPVLSTFGAGITLDTASAELPFGALTAKCSEADAISTDVAIYDDSKINVYFVLYYGGTMGLTPAMNCWQESHPEIIFISWSDPDVTNPTLVHELGHALGLINPTSLGGHTYDEMDFHKFNLMATNTDVKEVTIGQLYAMNFSSQSWINRSGSPLVKPVVRTCQNSWGDGDCPALTKKVPSGWP